MNAYRQSILLLFVTAFVQVFSPKVSAKDAYDDSKPQRVQMQLYEGKMKTSKEVVIKTLTVNIWNPVRYYQSGKDGYGEITIFLWDKANLEKPLASTKAKVTPRKRPAGHEIEEIVITFDLQIRLPVGGAASFYVTTNLKNTEDKGFLVYGNGGYVRWMSSVVEDSGDKYSPVMIDGKATWVELWTKVK